ncbi:Pol polyprotein [Smittium culicis]|uniref:Pol polyprotein n=1 Tax=Smittium culicis TaxID=133412 RepID=A0A1R1Y3Z7_9FUNG|nr:Pol polyprotein [Smittium culicis]
MRKPNYHFTGKTAISGLFDTWEVDFVGPFPESKLKNKYIFTAIERLSGYPIAIPTSSTTASCALQCILEIVSYFGIPKVIRSDRNPFSSDLIQNKARELGFNMQLSPAYQPEWTGAVERLNSTIRYAITKSIMDDSEQGKIKTVHISRLIEFHKGIQSFEGGVSLGQQVRLESSGLSGAQH